MLWPCHSGRWWACSAFVAVQARDDHRRRARRGRGAPSRALREPQSRRRHVRHHQCPRRRGGRRGRRREQGDRRRHGETAGEAGEEEDVAAANYCICFVPYLHVQEWLLHLKDGIHGIASLMAPMVGAFFLLLNSSDFFLYPSTAVIRTCTCAICRWPSPR